MADAAEPPQEASTASTLGLPEDWPEQATDVVVRGVDRVRRVTTGPVVKLCRLLAYLIFGIFPVIIVLVLAVIAAGRGLEVATGRAWAAHGILGLLFVSMGIYAWSRRPS
ncbi:hypothetical protein [Candidatus Poriferisocius sp.]|uniref:hypothetical protein n=1 Tax=Candidatus Poriferisocius sp. TaxID=3101276 RepID=UPI003B597868